MLKKRVFAISRIFDFFYKNQQYSGGLLILATIASLIISNSSWNLYYHNFINIETPNNLGLPHSLLDWINDGLMTLFFLTIGIEIKRELLVGELSNKKQLMLPLFGAIGGMIVPAILYFSLNFKSSATLRGAGIPTATDIAFAVAVLGLLSKHVPNSLRIFLTALAIIDDLGAIVVIALFYGHGIQLSYLLFCFILVLVLLGLNRFHCKYKWVYYFIGIGLWYFMLRSGIHATISGVLFAFLLPQKKEGSKTISEILEHHLTIPISFVIIPIFAAFNTALTVNNIDFNVTHSIVLGIVIGLTIGKPLGIWGFSMIAIQLKIAELPNRVTKTNLLGIAALGGIGFTMSIFITNLAFSNLQFQELSKLSILIASMASACIGYTISRYCSI